MAQRANYLSGSDWLKNSFSIWRDIKKDTGIGHHPAPFPVSLAHKLLDCFDPDLNGVVLDPFAGSGSTLIAALSTGRTATGFDLNPSYRGIFEERLRMSDAPYTAKWSYHIEDARRIRRKVEAESINTCITSPPYWDILSRRRSADSKEAIPYSDNPDDLGNISEYESFLDALRNVSDQISEVLKVNGYYILNVMDIRKNGDFYPLHHDASQVIMAGGVMSLEDIVIWDRQNDYNSMRPLGYPYKFIINKVHEYLLIFRKTAPRSSY